MIEQVLVTILSGGHALLMGAPGLGKTLLVNTASRVLGLDATRIQFTPDLMPSDITGAEILDQDVNGQRAFRFLPGPIFDSLCWRMKSTARAPARSQPCCRPWQNTA